MAKVTVVVSDTTATPENPLGILIQQSLHKDPDEVGTTQAERVVADWVQAFNQVNAGRAAEKSDEQKAMEKAMESAGITSASAAGEAASGEAAQGGAASGESGA